MVTLENSKLFRQLGPSDLGAICAMAREESFSAGQEIFKEADAGDSVYVVKEGLVEISVLVGQNSRHVFSEIGPGDIFGEMAVIEDKPRSASAAAMKPTIVYRVPRAELLKLVERSPALALALLRDISARLREFNGQYLREVLQAERLSAVGRFARSIVHDLKNPLNIIGLSAEVATMERATPESRQQAREGIRQAVERISDMVSEILEFTQGSPSNVVLAPLGYDSFVELLLKELRSDAALKSATLELENPPPGTALLLNPKRLRRVFHNLVHNAIDAMPQGGKIILRFQQRNGEIVTEIEDSGPGIAAQVAGQLFEPFATFGKPHGTGLGLSICKRIIEDHKGWIAVRSEPGHGAIFAFGLPLPAQTTTK
jgi:signal transduction histidine kinase